MDPNAQQNAEGEDGDRGLKSFLNNVINRPKTAPPSNALLEADLKAISAAFKGTGTDEKALIAVLCQRSKDHLLQLKALYNWNNKLDLLSKIQLETSGRFQRLFEGMILDPHEMRAAYVHHAVDGIGTDEIMLIDTICTCSNAQIKAVQAAYKSMYMIGMELRVKWDVSGLLQDNLDAIMQAKRPESGVQLNLVPEDLALLVKATEGKIGTDEKALIKMISTRSRDHIAVLNKQYATVSKSKKPFIETIKAETSGIVERAFIANFATPTEWFAFRIYAAMNGLGTDEESLMRCILLPSQGELKVAMRIIKNQYKRDLAKELKGELWGKVRDALVTYVSWVEQNVPDMGDVPSAVANAANVPAATAATTAAASAGLATNPHANRIWKSIQEEVEVLRKENQTLRAALIKANIADPTVAQVSGSRSMEPEMEPAGERSFHF